MYVLLIGFVPSAFVFYSICNICSFFFCLKIYSRGDEIFFLNLTKLKCIVKFLCASSFVCGSYLSLGIFLNRFLLHLIRKENSLFPYFISFPENVLVEGQRAKEGKVPSCTHTLPLRKTSEKGTEKWNLSTVSANSSQMSLPWCDIFHKERSTITALE